MDYRIDTSSDCTIFKIQGVLTFDDHEKFKNILKEIAVNDASGFEMNLSETKMIDSAGIGMLLLANHKAKKVGKTIKFSGVTGHVAKVIELSKVDKLISIV